MCSFKVNVADGVFKTVYIEMKKKCIVSTKCENSELFFVDFKKNVNVSTVQARLHFYNNLHLTAIKIKNKKSRNEIFIANRPIRNLLKNSFFIIRNVFIEFSTTC